MIKEFINSLVIARRFNFSLKAWGIIFKGKKTYKVRITKEQMLMLEYCAMVGIKNTRALREARHENGH